jgi:hypothetical protein
MPQQAEGRLLSNMNLLYPLLLVLAAPAAAAQAPSAADAEAQLAAVAGYFVPPSATDFMVDSVDSAIRQRVLQDPQLVALERAFPGIGEAMIRGASAEVRRVAPAAVEALQADVRRHLSSRLSESELRLFSDYVSLPSIAGLLRRRIDIRTGETASDAAGRHFAEQEGATVPAAERSAMERFERSRDGRRILEVAEAYMPTAREAARTAADAAGGRALQAALRAGNAFARERHPERPRPFAVD